MGGFNSELSCGHVYIYTSKAYRYYFFFCGGPQTLSLQFSVNFLLSIHYSLEDLEVGAQKKNKNSEERERGKLMEEI
jgi:hypothetical protein